MSRSPSLLLSACVASAAALRLPATRAPAAPSAIDTLARQATVFGLAALLSVGPSASVLAATAPPCQLDCFRECNIVAPGNKEYCSKQCDSYCAEVAAGEVTQV